MTYKHITDYINKNNKHISKTMSANPVELEFTKVSYKRKGKRNLEILHSANIISLLTEGNTSSSIYSFHLESHVKKIAEAKENLLSNDAYQSVRALLRESLTHLGNPKIAKIICFGLGQISERTVPVYQFALLLCLKDLYKVTVQVSDPMFNDNDLSILKYFDIEIEENIEGKYHINNFETTLFYMPHCPKQLMNNLLWANWGLPLSNCIIIGNSIGSIIDNFSTKVLEKHANFVSKISPYLIELLIVNSHSLYEVFNDTAIHIFPINKLKLLPTDFWLDNREPTYLDTIEFIRKSDENR